MNDVAQWSLEGRIAVLTVDNPPVNAISQPVREALAESVARLNASDDCDALVIACAGRTFFSGADIREFGKPPLEPSLPDVVDAIAASAKPVVAAIHGNALGGGLEVAMACHRRVATGDARLGLPEVKLGLLPGARGTQMLPRLAGVETALDMIVFGDPVQAEAARDANIVDVIADGDLLACAIDEAARAAGSPPRGIADIVIADEAIATIDAFAAKNARKIAGQDAPQAIIEAIRCAVTLPFAQGAAKERELFFQLRDGVQSRALRHVFFAEREVARVPEIEGVAPRDIASTAVIGSGTMGSGIATALLVAGFAVTLFERDGDALDRGAATIAKTIDGNIKAGRMTREAGDAALARLTPTLAMEDLGSADLVIEAAYETMAVKRDIFGQLDRIAKPEAILASNTSYLDIDEIAHATQRPESVLGLHFFSPAHIMKLLEIVRGEKTAPDVLATAFALGKRLRKVAVYSRNAWGFIGNRMLARRKKLLDEMVVEGAEPHRIDAVAERFGYKMGPFRVSDLAGLDLGWSAETSTGSTVRERLCEAGRRGQKTGAGYYDYDENRRPVVSETTRDIIAGFARDNGIAQREFSDEDILDRLLWPMVDEAAQILAEGVALRESDIDVVWLNGYGWPRWTGGPMFHARQVGLDTVIAKLDAMGQPASEALRGLA